MGTKDTIAKIAGELELGRLNPGALGAGIVAGSGAQLLSRSPIDEQELGAITCATDVEYDQLIAAATTAAKAWRNVPAPVRGSISRSPR
jgi:aldehyde dehydrogenase (NAD+)